MSAYGDHLLNTEKSVYCDCCGAVIQGTVICVTWMAGVVRLTVLRNGQKISGLPAIDQKQDDDNRLKVKEVK